MKVLFVNAVCGTGSTGNIIADLIHLLRTKGDQGCVCFGVGSPLKVLPGEAFKFNNKVGYYLHNAVARLTDHTGLYSRYQTHRLVRQIKKVEPDLVHLHNLHGYYVNYELLFRYLKQANIKVVWTLHDCWAMTGHCTHFVTAQCQQWKTACEVCPLLREYPTCYGPGDVRGNFRRKKAAFTGVENLTVVTPSRWLADIAEQSYLGAYPVEVVPNGINTDIFYPQNTDFREKNGLVGKKLVLGVANVWSEKKGLYDFYRLAERLPEGYQVVLVGLSEAQMRRLPAGIMGISRTGSASELARIYAAADVFVNPTHEEVFGLTSIEAQACGTPVVAYAVGGCPETIQPGCGETVPCGDLNALLEKTVKWSNYAGLIPVDRTLLSKDHCYNAYYRLYKQITR